MVYRQVFVSIFEKRILTLIFIECCIFKLTTTESIVRFVQDISVNAYGFFFFINTLKYRAHGQISALTLCDSASAAGKTLLNRRPTVSRDIYAVLATGTARRGGKTLEKRFQRIGWRSRPNNRRSHECTDVCIRK